MVAKLPEEVRVRPKAFGSTGPQDEFLSEQEPRWWLEKLESVPSLQEFVDVEALMRAVGDQQMGRSSDFEMLTGPLDLVFWLQRTGIDTSVPYLRH